MTGLFCLIAIGALLLWAMLGPLLEALVNLLPLVLLVCIALWLLN